MRAARGLILGAVALIATGAVAQTTVTNGNNGVSGAVPVYSGSATLGAGSSSVIYQSGSNVGIGTTAPGAPLAVNSGTYGLPVTSGTTQTYANMRLQSSGGNVVLDFGDNGAAGPWLQVTNKTDLSQKYPLVFQPNGGNVGIGKLSPTFPLDVNGSVNATQYCFGASNCISAWPWTTSGSYTNFSGSVGIGTSSPEAPLQVFGTGQLAVFGNNTLADQYITIRGGNGSGYFGLDASLNSGSGGILLQAGVNKTLNFAVGSDTWGAVTPQMTLTGAGNLGIGTTSPGTTLEVNGPAQIDGALTGAGGGSVSVGSQGISFPGNSTAQTQPWTGVLCGGDYAESVDVTGDRTKYEPGDVLVIDPDAPGKFLKSAEPYSTSVTGIYSTKPGTVGRRQPWPKSADEVPMAMIGIVPTKVSAENGPIRPGELLVTSSTIGYAMKGTDRSRMMGAVIGKALGSLDSGVGLIEVVVTLQ